jgi:3-deoxy-manno-octulosonate cytidylyltransferase (CMP-KDO synthetase)
VHPTDQVVGVIPARLASTRLPRKALLPIAGIPMIERVYRGAVGCRRLRRVVVATDSQEIARFCDSASVPVLLTSPDHPSGTDRVHEVLRALDAAAVVNIQGDEPMVRPEMLDVLLDALFASPHAHVASLCTPLAPEQATDPAAVKVVTDARGCALYFSRAAIPFPRDGAVPAYRKHLGFYAYSRRALELFHHWPPGILEQIERLEQLRFLENGMGIVIAETPFDTIGVDTAEDLARVEALLGPQR